MILDLFPKKHEYVWRQSLIDLLTEANANVDEILTPSLLFDGLSHAENEIYQRGICLRLCVGVRVSIVPPSHKKPPFVTVQAICERGLKGWSIQSLKPHSISSFSSNRIVWSIPKANINEIIDSIKANIPVH